MASQGMAAQESSTRLRALLPDFLPHGHALSEDVWRKRTNMFLIVLWMHAVGLAIFGVVRGYGVTHSLLEGSIVAAFALLGMLRWPSRSFSTILITFGLLSSSAVLVHLSGGTIEAHFHFFVMMSLVPLYQSWLPFLLAIGYVVVHHGIMGYIDPDSVYNHPAAIANPVKWAVIHGLFILGASIAGLLVWKRNEELREHADSMELLALKHKSARELNDNVVQGLSVAKMAAELGDPVLVNQAINQTLESARQIVGDLLPESPTPGDFRRQNGHTEEARRTN